MPTKLLQLEDAVAWRGCVLTYGHFNTIHPGHIRYLRHACGLGKQLVVALIGDVNSSLHFNNRSGRKLSVCLESPMLCCCWKPMN